MRKNTFTFRHDYNASYDPKIRKLLNKIGLDGLGLYWAVVEILYQQGGSFPRDSYTEIAHDFYTSPETVARVIEDFGLFEFDEEKVWNRKVIEQLSEREVKAEKAKKSAQSRWERDTDECGRNANVMQTRCDGNAKKEIKEKDNNISISPTGSIDISPSHGERTLESENEIEALFDDQNNGDNITNRPDSSSPENDSSVPILTPRQCQNVIDFWNRTIDETKAVLPKVKTLGDERIKKIRIRWKEFSGIGDPVEVTRVIFRNACMSKFFQGDNPRGWSGNFDWIFTNSKNWAKIYEGNYNDKNQPTEKPATNGLSFEEAKRKQMEAEERDKKAALARLTQRT